MKPKKQTKKTGSTKSPAKRKSAVPRPRSHGGALDHLWAAHVFQAGDGTEPGGNLIPLTREARELSAPWPVVMTENLYFMVLGGPSDPPRFRKNIEDERNGTLWEPRQVLYYEQRKLLLKNALREAGRGSVPIAREWAFRYLPWGGDWVEVKAVLTKPGEIGGERLVLMAPGES